MKRLLSFLLALLVIVTLIPVMNVQAAALDISGDLNRAKPTKMELRSKWNEVTYATSLYNKTPSVTAPYAAGQLSDNFLQSGISYLNYVRYAANLPSVRLSDSLNENAQYGAVLLAAIDTLTHHPHRPDDMSDDFYEQGYEATTSSNISARYGYESLTCLQGAVSGCMRDSSSTSNLSSVGHRRWLLNPTLLNVGFGYAEAESGWSYITTKVFDRSGSGCDFDFISWPPSGNFPNNLFDSTTPWSITLNPYEYETPVLDNIKITITRASDGKTWKFNSATGQPYSYTSPYLTVENSYYGIPNCIIFHPGSYSIDYYDGIYTVDITGLYTNYGQPAELHYQVDFFDVTAEPAVITKQPESVTVGEGEKATVTVGATGDGLKYYWYFKDAGDSKFSYTSTFKGNTYSITMSDARKGRQVYCVITDSLGGSVKTKTVTLSQKEYAKITTQPKSVTVAEGSKATVTVKATGDGLKYYWYFKNPGASKFTYTSSFTGNTYSVALSKERSGRQVYCYVVDKYGNSVKSDTVTLTVGNAAKITTQPKSVMVADGAKATVTVKATGDGLKYYWYFKNPGASKFSYTSTFTGNTYTVNLSKDRSGRQVYCYVVDKYGNSVKSDTVTLTVGNKVKITTQPKNAMAAEGASARTTVYATGDGLTYEWWAKDVGDTKFYKSTAYKTATYSIVMESYRNGRQVYCVVRDKYGNSVKTNTVTLTMGNAAKITTQPKNVTVAAGAKATVKVTATGDGLTYKWYFKNPGATKFSYTSTFTGNTYSVALAKERSGRQVYCVVTDKYGNSVKSDTVTLTVGNVAKITTQPKSVTVTAGSKATVTVKATGDGLTYKWYFKNPDASKFSYTSTFTGNTYSVALAANRSGRQVYCVVTDKYGNSVKSNTVTLYTK